MKKTIILSALLGFVATEANSKEVNNCAAGKVIGGTTSHRKDLNVDFMDVKIEQGAGKPVCLLRIRFDRDKKNFSYETEPMNQAAETVMETVTGGDFMTSVDQKKGYLNVNLQPVGGGKANSFKFDLIAPSPQESKEKPSAAAAPAATPVTPVTPATPEKKESK